MRLVRAILSLLLRFSRGLLNFAIVGLSFCVRFLEQERTIILAVVPANQDVATVDILERAKMVRG